MGARRLFGAGIGAFFLLLLFAPPAAAESAGWRPVYDLVMLWVNFAILVVVLYKVLKRPLRDFFQDRKDELADEIQRIESERDQASKRVEEARAELEESRARMDRVRQRIVAEGERIREQIVQDAREQSRVMIAQARRRVDNQIFSAHRKFRAELVDMAAEIALQRLPNEVTDADNQRYIDLYLKSAG